MDWVTLIIEALTAFAKLPDSILRLEAAIKADTIAKLSVKIDADTRPLETGPTTDAQKDEIAKELASDIAHLPS